MGSPFQLRYDDEPRGEPFDEPRPDNLYLDKEEGCWRRQADESRVCGALLPESSTTKSFEHHRCAQHSIKENGRCRLHGGNTPTGKEHGAFKHGKYSKSLPDSTREKYESAREDDTLTTLREEIAVVESRIHLTLEELETEDSADLWAELENEVNELKAARDAQDAVTVARKIERVRELVEVGADERSKWREVMSLFEHKRRLMESERRREKALQAYVPIEDWKVQVQALNEVLREHIDDRKKLQALLRDLESVLGLGQ